MFVPLMDVVCSFRAQACIKRQPLICRADVVLNAQVGPCHLASHGKLLTLLCKLKFNSHPLAKNMLTGKDPSEHEDQILFAFALCERPCLSVCCFF